MVGYRLIRSQRRTLSIEISRDAEVVVRAPMRMPLRDIEAFLAQKQGWIESHIAQRQRHNASHPEPDEAEWAALLAQAKAYIPPRAAHYAAEMGVSPTAIHFSRARTRFGSCSGKNSITFSLRLMQYPREAIDYVVVHELAHIRYKDHGRDFYRFVASVLPDYREREALLRQ